MVGHRISFSDNLQKQIFKEISFPSFFRKMLMSAFLPRFKANFLEKMRSYP